MGPPSAPTPPADTKYPNTCRAWWDDLAHRDGWLRALRQKIAGSTDRLVRLIVDEIGKPEDEALAADVMPLLSAIRWHERRGQSVLGPKRLTSRPLWMLGVRHRVLRAPLGRVAIIATWNYPVQLLGIQMLQALCAGNRVVVKPSEHAPRTQQALLELFASDLPEGTLAHTEATREAGRSLLQSGGFDHLVFTGSTGVGREIAATLAANLIPSTLELSGRDSAFVLEDADAELAARCVWQGVTINAGQTCMAPRRALVHEAVYSDFLRHLGLVSAGEPQRRLITAGAAEVAHQAAIEGVEAGGRCLAGVLEPPSGDDGRLFRPTAIADCPSAARTVAGDHFGPVLAVVPVRSVDEALAIHHEHGQHLATSLFTRTKRHADALHVAVGSSVVTVNDCIVPTGHPATTLGGRGPSGWGHSRGVEGLLAMTRPVTVSRTSSTLRLPTGPPPPDQPKRLRQLIGMLYGRTGTEKPGASPPPSHPEHDPARSRDPEEVHRP